MHELQAPSDDTLAREHFRRVYNFCRTLLREEADVEDACQEVFLTVSKRRGELGQIRRVVPWLMKIALLTCLYIRRRRGRGASLGPGVDLEDDPPSNPPIEKTEDATKVRRALDRLPERYRAALVLHYQQNLPHEEMAEVLGVSRGAMRVLLHRAVMRLRQEVRCL